MKNIIHNLLVFIAGAFAATCLLLLAFRTGHPARLCQAFIAPPDTLKEVITIKDSSPVSNKTVYTPSKITIPLAKSSVFRNNISAPKYFFFTDTLHRKDTIYLTLNRQQRHYQTEDYEAWVSGFDPRLDSLQFNRYRDVITKTYTPPNKPHSLSLFAAPSFDGINTTLPIGLEYGYEMKWIELSAGVGYDIVGKRVSVQATVNVPLIRWQ
ncbi:MAG: hypothetical protein IJV84_09185 [Bacteroidales bacterium]|nr:hypothetical protein [Bacteroidales bacterium]